MGTISAKLASDLSGKLRDAITKLGQRKTADACKKIEDFVSKVAHDAARRTIPAAMAEDWLTRARHVRTLLGC